LDSDAIAFDERGLVPCIVQDWRTGEVLTLAYMNRDALDRTQETGETWFWSRSRGELWHKGATSGNVQTVRELRYDCDADTVLALVEPAGPACHTGERTCFHNGQLDPAPHEALPALERTIAKRAAAGDTGASYTARLLADPALAGAKVEEEAEEVVRAAREESEVRELARDHTLVPLRHTFIADTETPVSAYLKLRGEGPSFLLESAEQGQRFGRWSFLGVQPRTVMRLEGGLLTVDGVAREFDDPYAAVADELSRYRQAPFTSPPTPPPFAGGAIGLFGYDLVRSAEPTVGEPNEDAVRVPDLAVMVTDVLLAFDHFTHTVTVMANVFADGGDLEARYAEAAAAIADVRERLAAPVPRAAAGRREPPAFESNMGSDGYARAVERVKEYIRAGDAYQVVPSQRWSAELPCEGFSVYRGLRAINPSPYMYFLDFEDFQIAGASPEALVTVEGRTAKQRPIAGTRPRAGTLEGDARLAEELLADDKERAEHVMLVDLGRNDLGRVCEYGSVHVDELMTVETYSHVLHIVSSVSGTLREGVSPIDALRASLPAGTLSGAPKIRAMQIIDELEPVKRGPYGGAIGYLSYTGDLDSCIFIRSAVIKDGHVHIQAGGGIVADSDAAYEVRETEAKAGAVRAAIELACREADWA
jgi:anthranilate synthase component 1